MTWQGCVQKFQKIGQTIFLESGGLAGREFAGVDGCREVGDVDGSGVVEEVGFGFGGDGGEFIVVAKEVEKICAKILQVVNIFQSHFGKRGQTCFPRNHLVYLPTFRTLKPMFLSSVASRQLRVSNTSAGLRMEPYILRQSSDG